MDTDLIKYVIVSVTVIFALGLISFAAVGFVAFSKVQQGAGKSFGLLFQRGNFLRIITVLGVILAVIYLGSLTKLSEGSVAILSAIAGFVLGGLDKTRSSENEVSRSDGN